MANRNLRSRRKLQHNFTSEVNVVVSQNDPNSKKFLKEVIELNNDLKYNSYVQQKRKMRRKVRASQDFQNIGDNICEPINFAKTHIITKTKKSKNLNFLPMIKDFSPHNERNENINLKQNSNGGCLRRKRNESKYNSLDPNLINFISVKENVANYDLVDTYKYQNNEKDFGAGVPFAKQNNNVKNMSPKSERYKLKKPSRNISSETSKIYTNQHESLFEQNLSSFFLKLNNNTKPSKNNEKCLSVEELKLYPQIDTRDKTMINNEQYIIDELNSKLNSVCSIPFSVNDNLETSNLLTKERNIEILPQTSACKILQDATIQKENFDIYEPTISEAADCLLLHYNGSTPYSSTKRERMQGLGYSNGNSAHKNYCKKNTLIIKKPNVPKKMPNFSLIHKQIFEKMENIEELSQRKAKRAKLLLSGSKPELGCENKSPNKMINKRTKKLEFALHNNLSHYESSFSPKQLNSVKSEFTFKNNQNIVKHKSKDEIKAITCKLSPALSGHTKFGFKKPTLNIKSMSTREQVKTVVNKCAVLKNCLNNRRNIIKGVRSNRRFELLMKLRQKA